MSFLVVHFNDSDLSLIPDALDVNTLIITELEKSVNISWAPSFTSRGVIYYRVWWQVDASPRQEKVLSIYYGKGRGGKIRQELLDKLSTQTDRLIMA